MRTLDIRECQESSSWDRSWKDTHGCSTPVCFCSIETAWACLNLLVHQDWRTLDQMPKANSSGCPYSPGPQLTVRAIQLQTAATKAGVAMRRWRRRGYLDHKSVLFTQAPAVSLNLGTRLCPGAAGVQVGACTLCGFDHKDGNSWCPQARGKEGYWTPWQ